MSLQLTSKQLATIRDAFGFADAKLGEPVGVSGGFSGAGVWKIEIDVRNYALRRWPAESLPRPRILGLHRLLKWWHSCGFPEFAVPCSTIYGSTLLHLDGEEWQLEPWMTGVADFHDRPTDERLRAVCTWLARLHLVSASYQPDEGSREWFSAVSPGGSPNVSERLDLIRSWNVSRLHRTAGRLELIQDDAIRDLLLRIFSVVPQYLQKVGEELQGALGFRVPLFPCLRDFWHDHLLFTGECLTGVVDPSACRTESPASDLSRLLGSLFPLEKTGWDRALEHYVGVRQLRFEERQLIEVLDRSQVVLSGLYWGDRLAEMREDCGLPDGLQQRLRVIVDRLGRL